MRRFAIAGLQLELDGEDNQSLIEHEVSLVKKRYPWLDLVMLGELSTFGAKTEHAQSMPGDVERRFCHLAKENNIWLLPGSLYEQCGDEVYNTTPVINPQGEVVARYRKMYPFLPYEKNVTPGSEYVTFDIPDVGRFGVSICYDMWFPETIRTLACQGAEVILHPTMTNTIDRDAECSIARANATINQCYFVDINVAGKYGVGRSVVYGPGGEVIHEAGSGREIITLDVDLEYVRQVRERGWQGLGQPLKSFRDGNINYPMHQESRESTPYLDGLGVLKRIEKDDE